MPKYGGMGKQKQACIRRKCSDLRLLHLSSASAAAKSFHNSMARFRPEEQIFVRKRRRAIPSTASSSSSNNDNTNKSNIRYAHNKKMKRIAGGAHKPTCDHLLYHQIAGASARLGHVYGTAGPGMFPWKTSVLGTVIGLICAQNTTNSFSAIMYNNLVSLCPDTTGLREADWDLLSRKNPGELQVALSHGPFYRLKSRMILKLLHDVREQMGTVTLEPLLDRKLWPDARVRSFLTSFTGIGAKTTSCIMLYRLQRLDFAVDTNILKIGARMGWFKAIGVTPEDALPTAANRVIQLSHTSSLSSSSSSSSSIPSSSSAVVEVPSPPSQLSLPQESYSIDSKGSRMQPLKRQQSLRTDIVLPLSHSSSSTSSSSPFDIEDLAYFSSSSSSSSNILQTPQQTPTHVPCIRPPRPTPPSIRSMPRQKEKRPSLSSTPPLKRHAKATQSFVQSCLAYHQPSFHKWSILYQAHLRLIAHGEVFCHTRRPLCGTCPLSSMCDFAKTYPSYMRVPPTDASAELSCTLPVRRVVGTVAVTHSGVKRPIRPHVCKEDELADAATWGGYFDPHFVQMVLHELSRDKHTGMAVGRLFISPWLAFQGVFPMRGTYFLQNELFEVEGTCHAPLSSLSSDFSVVHLARSMPVIFRSRPLAHISRIFRSGFVCGRRFRFPRQLRSYGKHFQGRLAHGVNDETGSPERLNRKSHRHNQDILDAMNRIIHILENKQREEDWKQGRLRKPQQNRRKDEQHQQQQKKKKKKTRMSKNEKKTIARTTNWTKLIAQSTSTQNMIALVRKIQTHRYTSQLCKDIVLGLISRTVLGCNGELICLCFKPDVVSLCTVQCSRCMVKYHWECAGMCEDEASSTRNGGRGLLQRMGMYFCPACLVYVPERNVKKLASDSKLVTDNDGLAEKLSKHVPQDVMMVLDDEKDLEVVEI